MLDCADFTWPPLDQSPAPRIIAPPHLAGWAKKLEAYLADKARPHTIGFATSGSSGGIPKAILFTRDALEYCAQGAINHFCSLEDNSRDEHGDWVCPLPPWHVGGAMISIRAHLAGVKVHTLTGKWDPSRYADLMRSTKSRWSSLVPTQVIDLVTSHISAPTGIHCIIVGGGHLDTSIGQAARQLGWPVVQSYGMTEAGSQIATALPQDPFHTDKLNILPHWETRLAPNGRLSLHGKGLFYGQAEMTPLDDKPRTLSFEQLTPNAWWTSKDLVQLNQNTISFIRRADRIIKILGELVDPDIIEQTLSPICPNLVIEPIPHPRMGYELVACHPNAQLLEKACTHWNLSAPGFQRITRQACLTIPRNTMGKIERTQLRSQLTINH
ncbi:MAG: AMP-binding protein [Akkermansia sp.]